MNKITEEMKSIIGGIFYEGPFDLEVPLEEEIIEQNSDSPKSVLEIQVEFCDLMLDPKLLSSRRRKIWIEIAGEQWDVAPKSLTGILKFLRDESIKELEARKSGEKPEPKF